MVDVGVGVVARIVVGEAVGLGPAVLAIVESVAAPLFGITGIAVDGDDLVFVVLVLVSYFKDVPSISS